MKRCFAYIRVSTVRQGEQGASLAEQRAAIERYAERLDIAIVRWYEEIETAAKRGRQVFATVVRELRAKKAEGLVMHKIDRSTRNYYDWAEINDLVDRGTEVHFASENLELGSRGRRLLADIQAVFATDYIRNLREEIQKGIDGRLKAGLLPWGAPVGYLDHGRGGKQKTICPHTGPLVRTAFDLYATGEFTLDHLLVELRQRGLRSKRDRRISLNGLSRLLRNRFYIGLIKHEKTGTIFRGAHDPLVPVHLFERVQDILDGRVRRKVVHNDFRYRRMFVCGCCHRNLTGERQKGHIYYRCHTNTCRTTCVREEVLDAEIARAYTAVKFAASAALRSFITAFSAELRNGDTLMEETYKLQLSALRTRHGRLVDAYVDGQLPKAVFETRSGELLTEERALEELSVPRRASTDAARRLSTVFELAAVALQSHQTSTDAEKRLLLRILTSNRVVREKKASVELSFPFNTLQSDPLQPEGERGRSKPRTKRRGFPAAKAEIPQPLRHRFEEIVSWIERNPNALDGAEGLLQSNRL